MLALLGEKTSMVTALNKYKAVPVSVLDISDSVVAAKRKINDMPVILVGFGKKKRPIKSEQGQFKELGYVPQIIKQFKVDDKVFETVQIGDKLAELVEKLLNDKSDSEVFVDVTGISKGKGFAGVIKKWGFHRQPKTHGQSDRERHPGAIGAQTPGRVFKGKHMAGRMGNKQTTVKNLKVVDIIRDNSKVYLVVKGAVPGPYKTVVSIKFI